MTVTCEFSQPAMPDEPILRWECVKPGCYRGGIAKDRRKKPKSWPFRIIRDENCWLKWTLYDHSKYKSTVVMKHFATLVEAKKEAWARVFDMYYDERTRSVLTHKLGEEGFKYLEAMRNKLDEISERMEKLEKK